MSRVDVYRSRFFWKLYLTFSLIFIAAIALVGVLVYRHMDSVLLENVGRDLKTIARVAESLSLPSLENHTPSDQSLASLIKGASAEITIYDEKGKVLTSSRPIKGNIPVDQLPEFQVEQAGNFGLAQRRDGVGGIQTLYIGRRIVVNGSTLGYVSVAQPLEKISSDLESLSATITMSSMISIAVALILSWVFARHVTVPISEIARVTEALGEGRYDMTVNTLPNDEIGQLGDTINRISRELNRKIRTISQERAQLSAMLTSLVEGIVAVDDHKRILYCNQAARDLLRNNEQNIRGQTLADMKGYSDLDRLVEEAREKNSFVRCELNLGTGPRSKIVEVNATKFRGQETSGVIVVLHDVTSIRRLERIRRDFVANVSHEIKTPLTSIKGYVETILDQEVISDPETLYRFLSKIDRNVARLESLVLDIISLAKIESHEGLIQSIPIDWKPIINSVMGRHEDAIKTKQLKFRMDYPDQPIIVHGDKEAMTQVLDNLMSNAIKYTPAGGRITVRVRATPKFGEIEVEDTGIGIPEKHLDRIFERFYRVDKARSRDLGGTGLGLSIVKHLVSGMRGDVAVQSAVGGGSCFRVRLNLAH